MGQQVKFAVSHEVVHLLPNANKNCTVSYLNSFDDCILTELFDMMLDQVGCTVPWVKDRTMICVDKKKAVEAFKIYQENRRNQDYICLNSCRFSNVYLGPPILESSGNESLSQAIFYFKRDIKLTEEFEIYSLFSLAADIGAYVGLFLGASMINLGRMDLGFILDWFCRYFEKSKKTREIQVSVINV